MNRRQLDRKRLERQRVNRQIGEIDSIYKSGEEINEWEKQRNERMKMTTDGKTKGRRIQSQKINNKSKGKKEKMMILNILGVIILIIILFGTYKLGYSVGKDIFGSIIQISLE